MDLILALVTLWATSLGLSDSKSISDLTGKVQAMSTTQRVALQTSLAGTTSDASQSPAISVTIIDKK